MTFEIERIDHVALAVADAERSIAWYQEHLGFERMFANLWAGAPFMVGSDRACLALFPAGEGSVDPAPVRMLHVAFRVSRAGFERARQHLGETGLSFRDVEHENCWSLYFADPDGHQLELTTYQPGDPN